MTIVKMPRMRQLHAASLKAPPLIHSSSTLSIHSLPVTPFAMNQYLLICKRSNSSALIDCGDSLPSRWLLASPSICSILQTHGHVDHVSGLAATKALLPSALIHACKKDWPIFLSAPAQGKLFGLSCPTTPEIDVYVEDEDVIKVGDIEIRVMETPGHSPGHICFYIAEEKVLIAGDLIFKGAIGRTDFPGCNGDDMKRSLARVAKLPPSTLIFPGHGPSTSVGKEVKTNPFLQDLL